MSNEEKILKLMEKLYTELTEFKVETKEGMAKVNHSLTRIEQEQGSKISALFDAREVQFDVNERISDTLNRVEGKLDKLSLRVARHDDSLRKAR